VTCIAVLWWSRKPNRLEWNNSHSWMTASIIYFLDGFGSPCMDQPVAGEQEVKAWLDAGAIQQGTSAWLRKRSIWKTLWRSGVHEDRWLKYSCGPVFSTGDDWNIFIHRMVMRRGDERCFCNHLLMRCDEIYFAATWFRKSFWKNF
jgi:hypothetical protein